MIAAVAVSCSRLETAQERAERGSFEVPAALAFDPSATDTDSALRLALVRPSSWDPIEVSLADQDAVIVADLLFDGLTESTADGRLIPALATGWSATEDFYAWTFALDSQRTSADGVKESFERLRREAPDSAAVALLSGVARIDVVDSATVRFVLSEPDAGFAWLISGLAFSVADETGAPSGRYVLVEEGPEHSTLTKGSGADSLSVIIDWVDSSETALAMADTGDVDGAVVPVGSSDHASRDVGAAPSARSIVRFYGLDPTSAALTDLRVRQAVLAAVDAGAVVDELGSPGFEANGLVAPTTAGFSDTVCATACDFDPDRARALLADDGELPTIRVGFTTEHERLLADSIVAQLDAVGLAAQPVEIVAGQLSVALDDALVDIYPYGWVAPAGSIDAVLPPLLAADSAANPMGSISAGVDEALAAAKVMSGDAERWALLQSAHQQALAQAVLLPIAVAESRFVVSPAFTGVVQRADGSIEIRSLP